MAANMPRLDLPEPVSRNVTLGGKPLKVVEQRLVITQVNIFSMNVFAFIQFLQAYFNKLVDEQSWVQSQSLRLTGI
jgi:hypothetical protein